jgi:hypothetical protein
MFEVARLISGALRNRTAILTAQPSSARQRLKIPSLLAGKTKN